MGNKMFGERMRKFLRSSLVLDSRTLIKRKVTTLGGEWDDFDSDFSATVAPIERRNSALRVEDLKQDVTDYLNGILSDAPDATLTVEQKEKVDRILHVSESDWTLIRRAGTSVFQGNQRAAADRLLDSLSSIGIVPLEVGSLESFAPQFPKNRNWLPDA